MSIITTSLQDGQEQQMGRHELHSLREWSHNDRKVKKEKQNLSMFFTQSLLWADLFHFPGQHSNISLTEIIQTRLFFPETKITLSYNKQKNALRGWRSYGMMGGTRFLSQTSSLQFQCFPSSTALLEPSECQLPYLWNRRITIDLQPGGILSTVFGMQARWPELDTSHQQKTNTENQVQQPMFVISVVGKQRQEVPCGSSSC